MRVFRWDEIEHKASNAQRAESKRRARDEVALRSSPADAATRAEVHGALAEILRHRLELQNEMPGLAIVPGGRSCETCGIYERRITWADYDAGFVVLPPLHPGCMCTVRPWIRSPGAA